MSSFNIVIMNNAVYIIVLHIIIIVAEFFITQNL